MPEPNTISCLSCDFKLTAGKDPDDAESVDRALYAHAIHTGHDSFRASASIEYVTITYQLSELTG